MSASAERKKKKEGFLTRQAKAKNFDPISEEELLRKDDVAPDDVLRLNKIAESRFSVGLLFLWQRRLLYCTIWLLTGKGKICIYQVGNTSILICYSSIDLK